MQANLSEVSLESVEASLRRLRVLNVGRELDLQKEIANQFTRDGIPYEREVKLGPRNVIDFLVAGGIGIEVKKGKPRSTRIVMAQVERYAAFDAVKAIIVVVEGKLQGLSHGSTKHGKPVRYVGLAQLWGVAI